MMSLSLWLIACSVGFDPLLLAEEKRIQSPATWEMSFLLKEIPKGRQVRLALDARVAWPSLSGFNPWLSVKVNGTTLRGPSLLNKPVDFTTRNGVDFVWAKDGLWTVLYAPDFTEEIRTRPLPWGFADTDPYHFVWDITPQVQPGQNKVAFTHPQLLAQGTTLVLRKVRVDMGEPVKSLSAGKVEPAPAGLVPTYVAQGRKRVPLHVDLSPGGSIRIKAGARTLQLNSRTSAPAGKWVDTTRDGWQAVPAGQTREARWHGPGYAVQRRLTVRDDHIHVADTFSNSTDKIVGVIYQNRLDLSQQGQPRVLLAGRAPISASYGVQEPGHPSAMALWDDLALGLLAEDDIFRVHVKAFAEPQVIGLADPRLGLPPGKGHTLEWCIYLAPQGDYWDLINAIRRNWGCNITIPGPSLFGHNADGRKSQQYFNDLVGSRRIKLICSGQTDFQGEEIKNGVDLAEGTAIPLARRWCTSAAAWVRKLQAADPAVVPLVYLHPAICTEPGAEKKYADCRLLDATGGHVTSPYRYPVYMYLASLDNAYGRDLFRTVEKIFKDINPGGIYMDEISRGSMPQYAYHTTWDGCTLDIDPGTHQVTGPCTSVILLGQPWKSRLVKYLHQQGKMLVGNGPACTRTMLGWQSLLFTELNSYSFLIDMHLSTPVALGNHDHDNDERVRARMVRKALDQAGIIYAYSWGDQPQGVHYMPLMFPLTPVELRPGMILGRERIITNRSGRYGWPDGSPAEAFVFDGAGQLVPRPLAQRVGQAGQLLTEVRMPSDHFAVLVKVKQ